jgi:lambda family phage portal protein
MKKIRGLATDIIMEKVDPPAVKPQSFYGGYPSNYGMGFYGGSGESGGKWRASLSQPGVGLFLNHFPLRQGARVAMQDSPQGRAIVERKVDAIAYVGLKLEPTPDADILGVTQEDATKWSKGVASRFDLYASDKKQNRSETMTLYQAMWLYSYFKERDNDIFVRLYYSTDRNLQNPLQFEFIDPDQVRGAGYTVSYGFQGYHDGIIRDERGREVGYKIWVKNQNCTYKPVDIKAKGPKSGRIFMLHGFRPEYAGQGRGLTKLAPIIQELENLTDFSSAHIKQAINQAIIAGWIVPSKDEDTVPVFESLSNDGVGNFSRCGTDTDDDCESVECTSMLQGDFECQRMPEATITTPGIFLQGLTKGADIKFANPHSPGTTYDKFMEVFESSLSSVSGTPIEVVKMKFGNNYSASRATLLLFWRGVEIERQDMVADFLGPIQEMWMSGEIAAGRISAPGWSDPRLKAAWLKATWRGAPVPDIDPSKLAKAYREHIEIGIDSAERISQTHSGKSAADNIALNNLSYKDYEPPPFSSNAAVEEVEIEDDDDDEKEEK